MTQCTHILYWLPLSHSIKAHSHIETLSPLRKVQQQLVVLPQTINGRTERAEANKGSQFYFYLCFFPPNVYWAGSGSCQDQYLYQNHLGGIDEQLKLYNYMLNFLYGNLPIRCIKPTNVSWTIENWGKRDLYKPCSQISSINENLSQIV